MKNSGYDEKKEKILYRIVRISMTLAMVLIVAYMVTHVNTGQVTTVTETGTQSTEITEEEITQAIANIDEEEFVDQAIESPEEVAYFFRNNKLLNQHYEKHGIEMGFASAKEYEEAASAVINNPNALNKIEAEDGDYVYYVEETNEFVILSTDGYIRTYFNPSSGLSYYERQ